MEVCLTSPEPEGAEIQAGSRDWAGEDCGGQEAAAADWLPGPDFALIGRASTLLRSHWLRALWVRGGGRREVTGEAGGGQYQGWQQLLRVGGKQQSQWGTPSTWILTLSRRLEMITNIIFWFWILLGKSFFEMYFWAKIKRCVLFYISVLESWNFPWNLPNIFGQR